MERNTRAALTCAAALIPGVAASIMLYSTLEDLTFGLGLPLLMATIILTTLAVARALHMDLSGRRLWLLVPALFFAAMVAVRAEGFMTILNIAASLALGGLALHYLPTQRYPDEATTAQQAGAITLSGFAAIFGALVEVVWLGDWLRSRNWRAGGTPVAVLRGLALAVPILIVFGVLLASADEVFAKSLNNLFGIFSFDGMEGLFGRLMIAGVVAWGTAGMIAWGVRSTENAPVPVPAPAEDADTPLRKQAAGFRIGMIESGIILGSVNLMFIVFVLIQFTYLFGGQANIESGMTYANYARRGFFELVAVTVLVLTLGRVLDAITARKSSGESTLFRAMCVVVSALTLVILASAWQRMYLYEAAYGFTHLRLYTHVFMLALAALLGFFLLDVFRVRPAIFALGVLLVAIGYLVILNAMNVEQFIAERNIERYQQGEELDSCYLTTFSTDALPAMMNLYQYNLERGDLNLEEALVNWFGNQYASLARQRAQSDIFEYNVSRNQAWDTLSALPPEERTGTGNSIPGCYRDYFMD